MLFDLEPYLSLNTFIGLWITIGILVTVWGADREIDN